MKRSILPKLAASTAFGIALLISITAFAEGMAVRYSYAKTEFNGRPIYALIPSADPRFDSRTNKLNVQKAFSALKADKANTYLNTQASITGSDRTPKVSISIDPSAAAKGYSLIIMAETVYTLGELGVNEVSFPGYATKAMSRGDIPFVAFSVNVPLWKALDPSSRRDALNSPNIQVVMPNGNVVPSSEIAQKWRRKDKDIDSALYEYLKAPDSYTIKEVAKLLKTWNLPYGDKVVQLLGNPSTSVQNTGLELLADERDDKRVLDSVKAYLKLQIKKDKNQAIAAAQWLGAAKDPAFSIEKHLYFIDYGDSAQATEAAKALANYSSNDAISKLESKLSSKDENVALASAQSLDQQNQTSIEIKALDNKNVSKSVKLLIAKNLANSKDSDDQLTGLAFLVDNGSVKERTDAVEAIGAISNSKARSLLDGYLTSKDDFVRNVASEQLLKRADIASLNAVAAAMKSGVNAEKAQEIGDAIMEKLDFQTIERRTRDRNDEIQRLAYRAISKKAKIRSVLEILERGIENSSASIRGASTIAIVEFHSKYPSNVVQALKKSAADKDPSVRRDAAIAIGDMPKDQLNEELSNLLKDSSSEVSTSAIRSMVKRDDVREWNTLKDKTKDKDENLRAAAFLALAKLVAKDDPKGVREVISTLSGAVGDKSKVVKIAAIEGLGEFKDDRAIASIAVNASNDDVAIRIATLKAVANSGHASAKALLVSGLEDQDAAVRTAAVEGLGKLKDKSTKADLAKRLEKETDSGIRSLIEKTQKSL